MTKTFSKKSAIKICNELGISHINGVCDNETSCCGVCRYMVDTMKLAIENIIDGKELVSEQDALLSNQYANHYFVPMFRACLAESNTLEEMQETAVKAMISAPKLGAVIAQVLLEGFENIKASRVY